MSKVTYLTKDGLAKLKKELEHMVNVERPAISKQIGEAIEKGDISENAEYDAAKDAQGMLELKINELEKVMANARVLDASQLDSRILPFYPAFRLIGLLMTLLIN